MVVGTSLEKLKWCYFNNIVICNIVLTNFILFKKCKNRVICCRWWLMSNELVLTVQCVGSTVRCVLWWPGGGVGDPSRPLTTATSRRDFYYFIIIIFSFCVDFCTGKSHQSDLSSSKRRRYLFAYRSFVHLSRLTHKQARRIVFARCLSSPAIIHTSRSSC